MGTNVSASFVRWGLVLAGEAVLTGSLLSSGRWYAPSTLLFWFGLGSAPLVGYGIYIRSLRWSVLAGIVLLVVTLWTGVTFALVPANSRDGIEGTWFFLDCFLGLLLASAGWLLDRLFAGQQPSGRRTPAD